MNHETCLETRAAERYLTGELPSAEREAFEQHYFECEVCAQDVRLGAAFAANLSAVFEEDATAKKRGKLIQMAPPRATWAAALAAGLALFAFSGWQNAVVIPALRSQIRVLETPRLLAAVVLPPSARGAEGRTIDTSAGALIPMTLAQGAERGEGPYECRLETAAGAVLLRAPANSFDSDGNVFVVLPASGLKSGSYVWILSGDGGRREVDRYRFQLRRD
jgi:hypothetical protein